MPFVNAIPVILVVAIAWLGHPSWWALAMVTGGVFFAWGWLWGDTRLLDGRFGLLLVAIGAGCLLIAWALAEGLGVSLGEFQEYARGLKRAPKLERMVYLLPGIGIGIALLGLLVWSFAFARDRATGR